MKVKFSSLQILDNYGKGYADGEEKGFNDGLKTGNEQGYNSALERLETTDITANGTYTPNDIGFKKVTVNVPDLNGDYTTGYNDGYSKGNTDGYSQGYEKGETDGYNDGYTKGENVGYTNGYTQGNTDGFNSGYTQGESVGTENGYNNALSKLDELTVTQNGEYTPSEDKIGFSKVNVNIVDENGSYADGLAVGIQKFRNRIEQLEEYSVTAQDLDGVTQISAYALYRDEKLISITIPDSATSIGAGAFGSCPSLTSVTIGDGVTSIGGDAFASCSNLTNVIIGKSLENIGVNVFSQCYSLKNITIPNSLTSIGGNAFGSCTSLTELTIPESVTKINSSALKIGSTTNKATITFLGTTPPTISSSTFDATKLNQIIVPKGCGDIYKSSTNWSSFADFIIEAEE